MAKDKKILYFSTASMDVYENPSDDYYETFHPSATFLESGSKVGYIVFVEYFVYDSFSKSDNPLYEVIDLYLDREKAKTAAAAIRDKFSYHKREVAILDAEDRPVKNLPFDNWGYLFSRSVCKKVEIKEDTEFMEFR